MRLTSILLLLVIMLPAAAERLKDSGYGDGSLVDEQGSYYYPQPDGSYMDSDGRYLTPGEPGVLQDEAGGTLLLSPESDAFASTRWKLSIEPAPEGSDAETGPADNADRDGQIDAENEPAVSAGEPSPAAAGGAEGDIEARIRAATREGLYMDVGTGYLDVGDPWDTPDTDPGYPIPGTASPWDAADVASQPPSVLPGGARAQPDETPATRTQTRVDEALDQRSQEGLPVTDRIRNALQPFTDE